MGKPKIYCDEGEQLRFAHGVADAHMAFKVPQQPGHLVSGGSLGMWAGPEGTRSALHHGAGDALRPRKLTEPAFMISALFWTCVMFQEHFAFREITTELKKVT